MQYYVQLTDRSAIVIVDNVNPSSYYFIANPDPETSTFIHRRFHYLAKVLILASSASIDRISSKQYIREPCSFIKNTLSRIFAKSLAVKKRKNLSPGSFASSRSSLENRTLTTFSAVDVVFRANIAPHSFLSKNFIHELSSVSTMPSWIGGTGIWNCVSAISYEIIPQHLTTGSCSNAGRSSTIVAKTAPGWIALIFSE